MRISDWSSDVCSSDLLQAPAAVAMPRPGLVLGDRCAEDGHDVVAQVNPEREGEERGDRERGLDEERGAQLPVVGDRTPGTLRRPAEIGRAASRERVGQYVALRVVDGA